MVYLLQHLLMNSAKLYPSKNAVVYNSETITYKELDKITDKLADTLIENGARHGDRIGIYINKSIPAVISILGILKAGGIYVPLDANAPFSRLSYIVHNCGMRYLLTSTKKIENIERIFPEENPLNAIILTDDSNRQIPAAKVKVIPWGKIQNRSEDIFEKDLSIETDLAYILYTSGSTGAPKGVMISHRSSLTFINWSHAMFNIQSKDNVSSHAPFHFDLSIFDIFTSLKAGATIFLISEEFTIFPRRLIQFIQEQEISVWYSVPYAFVHMMVNGNMKNHSFPDIRLILFAGEVFPVKYLRELMEIIPHAEYYNLYGPTETNVCTWFKVEQVDEHQTKTIPIGKACSNGQIFAVDNHDQVVSEIGKEGELYVRGPCIANGYWKDAAKTDSCFLDNFLNSNYKEKIYKTGDIVKLDENGNYNLLGRKDHMIKSRGYRIELGEIESALYSHRGIEEAVAIPVPYDFITNKIKAFIKPKRSALLKKNEIQKFLSEKIPSYMIPEIIEFVESLPKTSTGKIDREILKENLRDS